MKIGKNTKLLNDRKIIKIKIFISSKKCKEITQHPFQILQIKILQIKLYYNKIKQNKIHRNLKNKNIILKYILQQMNVINHKLKFKIKNKIKKRKKTINNNRIMAIYKKMKRNNLKIINKLNKITKIIIKYNNN